MKNPAIITFQNNVKRTTLNKKIKNQLLKASSIEEAKQAIICQIEDEYNKELDWLFSTLNEFTTTTCNGINMN